MLECTFAVRENAAHGIRRRRRELIFHRPALRESAVTYWNASLVAIGARPFHNLRCHPLKPGIARRHSFAFNIILHPSLNIRRELREIFISRQIRIILRHALGQQRIALRRDIGRAFRTIAARRADFTTRRIIILATALIKRAHDFIAGQINANLDGFADLVREIFFSQRLKQFRRTCRRKGFLRIGTGADQCAHDLALRFQIAILLFLQRSRTSRLREGSTHAGADRWSTCEPAGQCQQRRSTFRCQQFREELRTHARAGWLPLRWEHARTGRRGIRWQSPTVRRGGRRRGGRGQGHRRHGGVAGPRLCSGIDRLPIHIGRGLRRGRIICRWRRLHALKWRRCSFQRSLRLRLIQ